MITSARGSADLSIGFDRDRGRSQRKLTNNKSQKIKFHLKIMLRDIFGFAEHQDEGTYGMPYGLTLTRNVDNFNLNQDNAINIAKMKFNAIEW